MKSAPAILPSALLLTALLAASCSKEAPAGAVLKHAVVIYLSGDVTATRGGQTMTVGIGDALAGGQTLRTGARSECELRLGNGTAIRIEEQTELLLDDVVLDPGRSVVGIRLVLGTVLCKVGMLSADERFRVRTPTAVVGVRGTEFGVTVSTGGDTLLAVRQGAVAILPAPIDLDELAAELKTKDPEVSAALAELAASEWIVRDGQETAVTAAASVRAEAIRVQVDRAIAAISRTKNPTAAEKGEFRAVVRNAAADIRGSVAAPTPIPEERMRSLERIEDLRRHMGEALGYGSSGPVEILNNSFEQPSTRSGVHVATDDWVSGGTWYGRWTASPDGARDGSSAVWASYKRGGPENGYSQELGSRYAVGHYTLSVWIIGDARGLVSLAMLGYGAGTDGYRIIGSSSTEAAYGLAAGATWGSSWTQQTLDLDILEGDPAVGKPIWIRFTTATAPAPRLQSDAERDGDSISWDQVTLTYAAYAGRGNQPGAEPRP